jgi:DNA relaxation protein homolog
MPILKSIGEVGKTVGSLKSVLNYVSRKDKKTDKVLTSGVGLDANVDKAFAEIMYNKRSYNKVNGKMYKHYIQSYSPEDNITAEKAHEIAVKFAEENFLSRGFKCYVTTHSDKDHIHTHFIMDNVSFENGLKYVELSESDLKRKQYKERYEKGEQKKNERPLEDLKKSSDDIAFFLGIKKWKKAKEVLTYIIKICTRAMRKVLYRM